MATNEPLVSVIVPIYGVEPYIAECIESIVAQSYENLEIILVNDKTLDQSGVIADDYAAQDSRIKVIHKPKNEGLNMARSTGYKASRGDLVTFVDSDDRILPMYVEKMVGVYSKTSADITMCGYIFYDAELKHPLDPQPITQYPITGEPALYTQSQAIHYYLTQWDNWKHNNNTSTTCCKLFTRDVLDTIDWYETDYSIGEDDFETIYTFSAAKKYAVLNDQMYLYRANPNSISHSNSFVPKFKGKPVSVFDICRDFEDKALKLFGKKHQNEIYYRVYTMYNYYLTLLVNKKSFSNDDLKSFDKNFPLNQIKNIKKHALNKSMLEQIEAGGLLLYLTRWMWSDAAAKQTRVDTLEANLLQYNIPIERHQQLSSHKSMKNSVLLFARSVKRRLKRIVK